MVNCPIVRELWSGVACVYLTPGVVHWNYSIFISRPSGELVSHLTASRHAKTEDEILLGTLCRSHASS
ncbi:Hypothetical predicted protein [Cloeon dipterum]|uniref:Uncharacterized protein n=1 Tax=Cloeon dipterum TaxID=197152 RepID=A0A8S1C967_9INSE|nr:Hypothetical predicted protein [Cloeon dipterum]